MKDNCDGNCTNCDETELTNIKDKDCDSIGYSYAYKTDCAGDRYIKIDEVRYLLKCERNKTIDDFVEELCKAFDETTLNDDGYYPNNVVRSIAEQLKAGGENES